MRIGQTAEDMGEKKKDKKVMTGLIEGIVTSFCCLIFIDCFILCANHDLINYGLIEETIFVCFVK